MRLRRRRDDEERDKDDEATDRYLHTRDYDLRVEKRMDRIFVRIVDDEETGAKAALWQRIHSGITADRRRAFKSEGDEHEQESHVPPDEVLVQVRMFTAKEKKERASRLSSYLHDTATDYLAQSSAWGDEDAEEDTADNMQAVQADVQVDVDPMDEDLPLEPTEYAMDVDQPVGNVDLIAELGL
jgi:hypothetical protein